MPQMMPIYWFFLCAMVNLFIHFFFSSYYHNFLVFSSSVKSGKSVMSGVSFLK